MMNHESVKKMAKAKAYDDFVKTLDNDFSQVETFVRFLSLDKEEQDALEESLKIIRKKIKKMHKVESLDEAKKHVKMKKIYLKGAD